MYLVQSDVKCKTFNFHFNSSQFSICVFLSESRLSDVINSIAADVLTTQQGAKSSADMVLAGFSWNILFRFQHQKSWLLFFILYSIRMEVCFCLLRTGVYATVDSSHRWLWTINALTQRHDSAEAHCGLVCELRLAYYALDNTDIT